MEKHFEVKTYQTRYECDNCKEGELLPTGKMFMSNPPKFPHTCDKCGSEMIFNEKYPKLTYSYASQ